LRQSITLQNNSHSSDPASAPLDSNADEIDADKALINLMRIDGELDGKRTAQQKRLELIGLYIKNLKALEQYKSCPMEGLAAVEKLPHWKPTAYEQSFLPGLSLAGIKDKSSI
jgi:hypothetical protein